jgi:CheY-like chemotaxis protein/two-component sensor histidine kinase
MEAIGQLAGGVAHDFNNLLTPILGYADMVGLNERIDDETRQAILEIHRAATQARDLTRQLLAFGRKQIMEVLPLDLNELVRENQSILGRIIREDIELQLDLADDLKTIEGDPSKLSQVIMNLAVNAVDAMPEGGSLVLETYNVQIDEHYVDAHPGSTKGPHVVLAVSDTGYGMDEQQQNRIFEPFFTTKEETKGTGLGLATVYGLVKQHHGSIRVYSEPGLGSTFRVYLPAVETAPETTEKPGPPTTRGDETVLVVEDDPAVLKYTRKALENQGYTVLTACNPEEALAHARDSARRVDLLLTDVVMPEMNGAQLHEQLSAILPHLGVLYMSGYTGNVIARHGVLKEGIDFIQKPFDAMELAGRIRQLLDRPSR